ncbi:class I SAM-dependent methyltransferase [Burkholderia ubonensis]|uniref:class I SAM-dependent methyltransferase n=1 Tax=Burkholderia ubonensis TaxID=101571 RepID=UPI0022B755A5|nr:methyltransferase domain-containing protein [Burkholderia ubonensis]
MGAEGLGERIEIRAGDVHALPFDDGMFIAVIGRSVVHHWADPIGAYREISSIIRADALGAPSRRDASPS